MLYENIENIFKKALIEFIAESSEDNFNTGYWLAQIIHEQLSISDHTFINGFFAKLKEEGYKIN